MYHYFEILSERTKEYRRFNAVGSQITIRFTPPSDTTDPVSHFVGSVNELFENVLRSSSENDMVGITIKTKRIKTTKR
jgi:hypothetical protein